MESNYYSKGRKRVGLWSFFRDVLIACLPGKFSSLIVWSLEYQPDYIFFTHPRNEEDIYATLPFIKYLKRVLPVGAFRSILRLSPCYIVAKVSGPDCKKGYIISTTELPETLFQSRELTIKTVKRSTAFFRKICTHKKAYISLAAWWPIVSNSGMLFERYIKDGDLMRITSGHTATIASIYLTVNKIADIAQLRLEEMKVLIIGVGKVGGAISELFAPLVKVLGLMDKNPIRIQVVKNNLVVNGAKIGRIEAIPVSLPDSEDIILKKIATYDLTVCTTSNTGLLVSDPHRLRKCIILDDSRPEAFPRYYCAENRAVVLEGGLIKIKGIEMDSDFGFGVSANVFGCLAEAVILSLDAGKNVKPNIGDIDFQNLKNMISLFDKYGIAVGDFKCADKTINDNDLAQLLDLSRRDC